MKPLTFLLTAALLSAANLSACSEPENGMSIQEQTEKRFQLNPHPKQAYQIKIKTDDAPGPLKLVNNMDVGYIADNCSYIISKVAGASAKPEKHFPIRIQQIGQNEYETKVYLDAMQDEDYFGQGVCHWKMMGFGTSFKATGRLEETRFNVSDLIENLIKEKIITKYYWKGAYPYYKNADGSMQKRIDGVGATEFGEPLTNYRPDQYKDLFKITVTLEELKQ
ncbi:MAG: hypothetical protein Q4A84_10740 [Neisseria sp.]|uniref:hypothetical protein n=1 Tax=Neisseria sp. TaxID=192066 RepID=UPI0026DD37FA|nr:hypothetical protein [Neisseria sp.]MDO4642155.1 hypothetical protein [Neisseria sp.]